MELSDPSWIDAVYERRLLEVGRSATGTVSGAVVAACENIGHQVLVELRDVERVAAEAGLDVDLSPAHDGGDQIHALTARVSSFDEAMVMVEATASLGYRPWEPWDGGARASFRRLRSVLTVARTDDRTYVLNMSWDSTSKLRRLPAVLRPNEADWSFVDLPSPLWFLYFAIRPIRLVGERLGLVTPGADHLGPFLATPESLLDQLFDFAEITADDVVVDLGCGDGRLVIEAANRRGCSGRGIETDPELVRRARSAAEAAGLTGRVNIVQGDAAKLGVGDASVVFVFLPADVAAGLIPAIVASLQSSARVIAHEQHRIDTIEPGRSAVLVADDAITVAHRWP